MIERLRTRIATGERQGGFTLIELLVVIVIIGILLAIAVPSYLGFKARAEKAAAQSNVRAAIPAMEAFYSDEGTYVGATEAVLKATYDSGLSDTVTTSGLGANAYCIESNVNNGNAVWSVTGPGGTIVEAACP